MIKSFLNTSKHIPKLIQKKLNSHLNVMVKYPEYYLTQAIMSDNLLLNKLKKNISKKGVIMSEEKIKLQTQQWINAIETKKTDEVLKQYATKSILLPTLSKKLCDTNEKRREYFDNFLKKEPKCKIIQSYIIVEERIHAGTYQFKLKNNEVAVARFTFTYNEKGEITTHHSSLTPE